MRFKLIPVRAVDSAARISGGTVGGDAGLAERDTVCPLGVVDAAVAANSLEVACAVVAGKQLDVAAVVAFNPAGLHVLSAEADAGAGLGVERHPLARIGVVVELKFVVGSENGGAEGSNQGERLVYG